MGFYGSYEKFLAVYYTDNKAAFLYTNDLSAYKDGGKVYTDTNNDNMRYAASIGRLPACDDATAERLIFEFTNAFRGVYGLPPLKWNDKLAAAARSHSEDMAKREFFSHINPDGKSPGDRITDAGYEWYSCAEKIAMMSSGIDAVVVDLWINSPGHRKAMLTETCDELGVGVSGAYGTQNYGKAIKMSGLLQNINDKIWPPEFIIQSSPSLKHEGWKPMFTMRIDYKTNIRLHLGKRGNH